MNENVSKISDQITRFLNNELNEEEKKELAEWRERNDDNRNLFEKLTNEYQLFEAVSESYSAEKNIYDKIRRNVPELNEGETGTVVRMQRFSWRKMSVAAAIVIAFAAGAYVWLWHSNDKQITKIENTNNKVEDISPGKDGAILQLADGKQIVLDDAVNGNLIHQGNTVVIKSDGLISYDNKEKPNTEVLYNTLKTPVGRQFRLILPDGSRIWLNSSSTITYPTVFTGMDRSVKVTGEVFMEVAKDATKPFRVHINPSAGNTEETVVEVLGTSFNINGYADEMAVKTTLVEGKVKITKGKSIALLKPGQQAQVVVNEIKLLDNVDIDKITAWRVGYFRFKEDKLSVAMKNIARWYNVDVVFEGNAANIEVSGTIPRSANISELLKLLAVIDVEARIEGRKLIVKAQ